MKTYKINEIFFSLQGEGIRAGTPNVFVRFAKCNLKCSLATSAISPGNFICDTEFDTYVEMTAEKILIDAIALASGMVARHADAVGVIFTGGEPGLQLDSALVHDFSRAGFYTAIETNGTIELHRDLGLDWICVSPKVADGLVKQRKCSEAKYVVTAGQALPLCTLDTRHRLLSPAFAEDGSLPKENLDHAIRLVKENPRWRLSVQQHKGWGVR